MLLKVGDVLVVVAERSYDVRSHLPGGNQVRSGFSPIRQMQPGFAEVAVEGGVVWSQFYRTFVVCNGPVIIAFVDIANTATIVSKLVIWIQFYCPFIVCNGPVIITFIAVRVATIDISNGGVRYELYHPVEICYGLIIFIYYTVTVTSIIVGCNVAWDQIYCMAEVFDCTDNITGIPLGDSACMIGRHHLRISVQRSSALRNSGRVIAVSNMAYGSAETLGSFAVYCL